MIFYILYLYTYMHEQKMAYVSGYENVMMNWWCIMYGHLNTWLIWDCITFPTPTTSNNFPKRQLFSGLRSHQGLLPQRMANLSLSKLVPCIVGPIINHSKITQRNSIPLIWLIYIINYIHVFYLFMSFLFLWCLKPPWRSLKSCGTPFFLTSSRLIVIPHHDLRRPRRLLRERPAAGSGVRDGRVPGPLEPRPHQLKLATGHAIQPDPNKDMKETGQKRWAKNDAP